MWGIVMILEGLRDSDVTVIISPLYGIVSDINQCLPPGNEKILLRLFVILEYGINSPADSVKV